MKGYGIADSCEVCGTDVDDEFLDTCESCDRIVCDDCILDGICEICWDEEGMDQEEWEFWKRK